MIADGEDLEILKLRWLVPEIWRPARRLFYEEFIGNPVN